MFQAYWRTSPVSTSAPMMPTSSSGENCNVGLHAVMPALPPNGSLEGLHYGFPAVSKARSTDHSLLVTYDNEQWLINAKKGILSSRKPSMTVDVARPQSWGVARLSFGMPKNVGRAVIAPEKPRSTPKWRQSAPDGRRL